MHPDDRKLSALLHRITMSKTTHIPEQEHFVDEKAPLVAHDARLNSKPDPELGWQAADNHRRRGSAMLSRLLGFAYLNLALLAYHFWPSFTSAVFPSHQGLLVDADTMCPQVSAITPSSHASLVDSLDEEYGSDEFKLKAYESLGAAVRIP